MAAKRRVVITGIGTLSACGIGYEPLWKMALSGRSSIRELSEFSSNGSPVKVGGEIVDFRPEDFIRTRKNLKVMSRDIRLAVAASILAIQDSRMQLDQIDRKRAGVTLGSGLINNDLEEIGSGIKESLDEEGKFQIKRFGREGMRALYPLWLLKYLPNMPACHISITHGLKGPNNTLMTSSTGGVQAVGEAYRIIQRDDADIMLAGATDSKINPLGLSRFHLLGVLSQRNHSPSEVYRPFDRRRDGMVVGEGTGIFVLEERGHALKRGAKIYGEILGYGATLKSQERSIKKAFEEAQRDVGEIGFIHAHGSGIPEEDILEAQAIARVLESYVEHIPVTASKSVTGHLIDAAGTTELSLSLLSLERGILPPIVNLEEPDPECDLNFVMAKPQRIEVSTFLLHSSGFGGQTATMVVSHGKS
ncbi:MAG: beta-ketoacyl-[acyl-carrier-protein] synthase family protein [Candidatus Omnitrophica bacterium]|nr:beta-ketoacyl-[acyl-carrier-protein] synthase family protein [Candidatus Omnitrophota bacterium]